MLKVINHKIILLILGYSFLNSCTSQEASINAVSSSPTTLTTNDSTVNLQLLYQIPTQNTTLFSTDLLRQCYLANDKEIIKFSDVGKELFKYSDNNSGDLAHIDATNTFSILLYYPNYQKITFLDRTLNKTSEVLLSELNIFNAPSVCIAQDNNFWVYDASSFQLKKLNIHQQVIVQSNDLSLELGQIITPTFMVEKGNLVYLNDPELGIFVFDIFGKYVQTIPFKGLINFQVLENDLLFLKDNQWHLFHLKSLKLRSFDLPNGSQNMLQVRVEKNRLFVMEKEFVRVYRLE